MCPSSRSNQTAGFTLIEVLIATALLVSVAVGTAHLFAIVTNAGRAAREQTSTTILAAAKLEELRSLTWAYEPVPGASPLLRTDVSADLSVDPPSDGGPGLSLSPPGTLAQSVPPYVEYLDTNGRWVGNGPSPPEAAIFVRRWSVRPLPEDPLRTLILSVFVTTVAQERARTAPWAGRSAQETLLVVLTTRKGR